MRRGRKQIPGKINGFTMLELLVVISLAILAIGVAVANFSASTSSAELKGFSRELVALLRQSRNSAMASGDIVWFEIPEDTSQLTLQPQGKPVVVPNGINVDLTPSSLPGMTAGGLYFFPDGSTNDATLTVTSDAGEIRIAVNWLSGEVSLASD